MCQGLQGLRGLRKWNWKVMFQTFSHLTFLSKFTFQNLKGCVQKVSSSSTACIKLSRSNSIHFWKRDSNLKQLQNAKMTLHCCYWDRSNQSLLMTINHSLTSFISIMLRNLSVVLFCWLQILIVHAGSSEELHGLMRQGGWCQQTADCRNVALDCVPAQNGWG